MLISLLYPFNLRGTSAPHEWIYNNQKNNFEQNQIVFLLDKSYLEYEVQADNKIFQSVVFEQEKLDVIYSRYERDVLFFKAYLTEVIPDLVTLLYEALQKILYEHSIDAVLSWSNCPSLQSACDKLSIPVIYNELGPLRSPYFIQTAYFDFKGVSAQTSASLRFRQFINDFINNKRFLLQSHEILSLFVLPEKLNEFNEIPQQNQYELGFALQTEDHNYCVYNYLGCINIEFIKAFQNNISSELILIRKHPASVADYSLYGTLDDSLSATHFIHKCDKIATINSGTALEAILLDKEVILHGDSPFKIIELATDYDLGADFNLFVKNFLTISFLTPFDLITNIAYIHFRLSNPSEFQIFLYHLTYYQSLQKKEKNRFSQLFYDTGKDFSEEESIKLNISERNNQYIFDLSHVENIKNLRFDPANFPCKIKLGEIKLVLDNGESHVLPVTFTNSDLQADGKYRCFHNDPILLFNFPQLDNKKILKCVVDMKVETISEGERYDYVRRLKSESLQLRNSLQALADTVLEKESGIAHLQNVLLEREASVADLLARYENRKLLGIVTDRLIKKLKQIKNI